MLRAIAQIVPRPCAACAAAGLALTSVAMPAAQAETRAQANPVANPAPIQPEVFVPSLWDPALAPPKPDPAISGPLRVITGEDDPPFDFVVPAGLGASGGTMAGFNLDLARAICSELGIACTVQARRWDTIVPALQAGAGDMAVASLSITPAALREVDFTSPYYRTPARFVARLGATVHEAAPAAIVGRRVGVEAGTAHAAYLRAFFPGAALVPYGSAADLRAALQDGSVELAFGDGIAWSQWLNGPVGRQCCAFASGPFTEPHYFGEGAGVAVKKGRDGLRRAVDYALWRLAASGTYADLWLQYFPVDPY